MPPPLSGDVPVAFCGGSIEGWAREPGAGRPSDMQFEALKVFCDVARLRSFSEAAAVNDLTQSAVSQIVLHLERRLDVQLIDRSTRP